MTDIEALREKAKKDAIYLGAGYIRIDANGSAKLLDPSCVQILSEDGLSELDRLRSSNEAMRKALEPFAKKAADFDGIPPPKYFGDIDFEMVYPGATEVVVTVAQLRAARAALSLQEEEAR